MTQDDHHGMTQDDYYKDGLGHQQAGRHEEAKKCFTAALGLAPGDPLVLQGIAECHLALGDPLAAKRFARPSLADSPRNGWGWALRALACNALGEWDSARRCFEIADRYAPHHPTVQWNRALDLLAGGDWKAGWELYRWGVVLRSRPLRRPDPEWEGGPWAGGMLLWAEQGFGDALMCLRYLPRVLAKRVSPRETVYLELPAALVPLAPDIPGVFVYARQPGGDLPFPARHHCSLMSLPGLLDRSAERITWAGPYLAAGPDRPGRLDAPRIGVCWKGSPGHAGDARRSMTQDGLLGPLLSAHRQSDGPRTVELVSLVPGCPLGEDPNLGDWGETARVVAGCDLIVTVDTAVAHLAGAMGKPVWTLLPLDADWRWLRGRADTPWYPSMTLIRQADTSGWGPALSRLSERFGGWLEGWEAERKEQSRVSPQQ